MTDVLEGAWEGLQDSLASATRMNKVLLDLDGDKNNKNSVKLPKQGVT